MMACGGGFVVVAMRMSDYPAIRQNMGMAVAMIMMMSMRMGRGRLVFAADLIRTGLGTATILTHRFRKSPATPVPILCRAAGRRWDGDSAGIRTLGLRTQIHSCSASTSKSPPLLPLPRWPQRPGFRISMRQTPGTKMPERRRKFYRRAVLAGGSVWHQMTRSVVGRRPRLTP